MTAQQKMIVTGVAALLLGFAIGAIWQYSSARGYAGRLDTAEQHLAFQQLEATLGAATIEAQRGSHEIARQLASDFFSGLQANLARAEGQEQEAFTRILQRRDAMITALSRSDPQSGSMLAQLFLQYRIAMGEPVGPGTGTASPPLAPVDSPGGTP